MNIVRKHFVAKIYAALKIMKRPSMIQLKRGIAITGANVQMEFYIKKRAYRERDLYYKRPASELIFLTPFDHRSLHSKDPNVWIKLREGLDRPETKKKRRETLNRPDVKKKKSEARIGRHLYTNGEINKFTYECPGEGQWLGFTKHKKSN